MNTRMKMTTREVEVVDPPKRGPGRPKKQAPAPVQVNAVSGEVMLPKALTATIRTNTMKNLRLSMARVLRAMAKGEVDPEFGRGMIWGLKEVATLLREEIKTERLAQKLQELEALLRDRPDVQDEVDVHQIRRDLFGEDEGESYE